MTVTVALVAAAGAASAGFAAHYGDGFGDWLFLTIVLSASACSCDRLSWPGGRPTLHAVTPSG